MVLFVHCYGTILTKGDFVAYILKANVELVITALKRNTRNEILRMDLCFIPTEVRSILPFH